MSPYSTHLLVYHMANSFLQRKSPQQDHIALDSPTQRLFCIKEKGILVEYKDTVDTEYSKYNSPIRRQGVNCNLYFHRVSSGFCRTKTGLGHTAGFRLHIGNQYFPQSVWQRSNWPIHHWLSMQNRESVVRPNSSFVVAINWNPVKILNFK